MSETGDPPGLSPGVAAAWGVRAATRGPRPKLTLDAIVAAAVAVADADGLPAVSMGRVAAELGASPMALYRHVASKEELLALMVDAGLGPAPAAEPGDDWRAALARWARAMAAAMRAHPWSTQVPISGPPLTPNTVAWVDGALAALDETRLAEGEKASVVLMLTGYVRNHVSQMAEVTSNFLATAATPDAAMRTYADTLRALVGEERHPALRAVLDAGVFDRADPPEAEFDFGLERILDGIEALTRSRSA